MILKYEDSEGSLVWIDDVEDFKFWGQMPEPEVDNIACDSFEWHSQSSEPHVFQYNKNDQITVRTADATQAYLVNSEGATIDVIIPPRR